MNRKNKGQGGTAFLVGLMAVVVIVGGLYLGGRELGFFSIAPGDGLDENGDPIAPTTCDSTTSPSVDLRAYDEKNVGTAITTPGLWREVNSITWAAFSPGTGEAMDAGIDVELIFGITTTDSTDLDYGPYVASYTVPCKETPGTDTPMSIDEVETELSATFFNADGDASIIETFSTGQSQTVSLKLLAGSDEIFGNPYIEDSGVSGPQRAAYSSVVCLNLNTTEWDPPERVSFDGVEMKRVSQPQRHTAVANKVVYCYEAPVITDSLMEGDRYMMRLNADDTNAPYANETAHIYAANFYIDTETGEVEWGIETNDGAAVGTDASDTVTLPFS